MSRVSIPRPIRKVAADLGIADKYLYPYGEYKAKISLQILEKLSRRKIGKYIVVTGMTPTPLGEGKTVTTIGLSMALSRLGHRAVCSLRQPSLGPIFGIKGGGAGGGRSQVVPSDDLNFGLTGDYYSISLAHNLLSSLLDNHMYHGDVLGIDPATISWRRVIDLNDRALRRIRIGLSGGPHPHPRDEGFDITAASEVMAILALSEDIFDLRKRLGRVVVARDRQRRMVTAEQLQAAGAMTVLLKEALKPSLMQTAEGNACLVHTGPFGNIAHGNNSILADRIGLRLADYVVTESGFGSDLGFEKFCNIKCRIGGFHPDAAVLVASVRAIKTHSGKFRVRPGQPLDPALAVKNLDAVAAGLPNLGRHIQIIKKFGLPQVVCINRFPQDDSRELEMVREYALRQGAEAVAESHLFSEGGAGGKELARAVVEATRKPARFKFLYPLEADLRQKIETIATQVYGAGRVVYHGAAEEKLELYRQWGYSQVPVCMAKTHLSLSHNPDLKGAPEGFEFPIEDVHLSAGAGFIYPVCGHIMTMPGLPAKPAGQRIDIDKKGRVVGL